MISQNRTGFRIFLLASIFAIFIAAAAVLLAYSTGPKAFVTGGLSVQTCNQSSCHTGNGVNSPSSKSAITLTGFPANFIPGQTYPLTIKVGLINPADQTSPNRKRFGFQLSARYQGDGKQAGTFTLPDSRVGFDVLDGQTTVPTPNPVDDPLTGATGILFVSHANAGSTCFNDPSCMWTLNWVAPNPAAGRVEFDVAGNSANGNNAPTDDFILTKSFLSDPSAPPSAPQFAASNPVSPNTGNTNGGIVVTINGSNFVNGGIVSFGDATAATTFVSSTQLTAVLPARATAGIVDVKVQNPDAQSATLVGGFTYTLAPPPQFAASNPTTPHIGPTDGGTQVTINGTGFISGSTVRFGSTPAASTQFISATQLQAVSPPASLPGAVDLIVRNVDGQMATLSGSFTYFDDSLKIAYAVATGDTTPKSAQEDAVSIAPVSAGIFSFTQNNFLVTTVGTSSATPTTSLLLFADSNPLNSVNGPLTNKTGIALINRSGSTALLTYTLRRPDGSIFKGPKPGPTLADGAHLQGFINEPNFFDVDANNFTGVLQVDSTQPISALTLQQNNNQAPRGETLFTSTPVADLTQPPPSGSFTLAQLADGGGFQTRIFLLNTTNGTITGHILFFKDRADMPDFNFIGFGTVTDIPYSIPSRGAFDILSTGVGALRVGFAMVVPDAGQATPVGTGMFLFTPGNFTVSIVGVPSSRPASAGLILADTNPTTKGLVQKTGLAIANQSSTQTADVTFKLRDLSTGNVRATKLLSEVPKHTALSPRGHTALFVHEIFINNEALNFTGTLSIETSSPDGISALTLLQTDNQQPRGESLFTTLPVAIASSFTGPVFLPQLVSGAGFETQIVQLNPALALSSGLLSFFNGNESSNGSPLALPINDAVSNSFHYSIPSNGGATYK